jgi:putative transposase
MRRIEAIQRQLDLSFAAAIPRAHEDYLKENADNPVASEFPSRATLFRVHKNQLLGLPVLKGDKNKGNTTPRYSNALVDFIQSVIQDKFLVTESTWTILDLTQYINREARRRCLHGAKHTISRKFVICAIQSLTADAEYDRMDPLNRVAGKSFAKKRIRAALPFARIEQDAVHLPFVVRTAHGVARTVYLVLAIDVCTGYPVGWYITVGAPREMDSLLCLERYLTPAKAARFKELGIAHALNVYGTPLQVIFDNGPETKGGRIVRLELLGMDVKHCKAKEAQGKPFIERLNKSLKEALQRLPGCTRFEGKDGKRDPEALGDELMSINDLEKWVVRWLYETWVNTPLERLRWDELLVDTVKGKTPLERLQHLTEEMGHPITMPPPRQEWMAALFEHKTCTLSAKTGITLEHGFRYKGDAISYLLGKFGDHAQLHVVYNPDDFRQAYVYESDELPLVTLTHEHVRADSPAWTFAEAKTRLDAGMADWAHPNDKVQFLQDMDDAVTAKSGKSTRKAKVRGKREENQETVRRAKDSSAVARTFERPLSSAAPFGPAPSSNPSLSPEKLQPADINYDDAPLMTIVNRTTGEKLL